MADISNLFLSLLWKLETSSRPFLWFVLDVLDVFFIALVQTFKSAKYFQAGQVL